jgi:cyclic pyranopterin phosphate synthase
MFMQLFRFCPGWIGRLTWWFLAHDFFYFGVTTMYRLTQRLGLAQFSHSNGMVDISQKCASLRVAIASCLVRAPERIVDAVFNSERELNKKGDILCTARLAGALAAKKTAELIPLCHQVPLSQVSVDISRIGPSEIELRAQVKTINQTGVEMEALTAVSISALTIYDMTKSALKGTANSIVISDIKLESKTGGSSSNPS